MPQTTAEKRDRFARMFPPRVEKARDQFRLLTNCSNPSNYEWTPDLVQRAWLELGKEFAEAAAAFDLELVITVNGANAADIDTSKPLDLGEGRKQLSIPDC